MKLQLAGMAAGLTALSSKLVTPASRSEHKLAIAAHEEAVKMPQKYKERRDFIELIKMLEEKRAQDEAERVCTFSYEARDNPFVGLP